MSTDYGTSALKRHRATKAEVEGRCDMLYEIVQRQQPMTVRQVFYQATVIGLVDKNETGYRKVQHTLAEMRRAGFLPFEWLADNTRRPRKPRTFSSIEEALNDTARLYRKSLWDDAEAYVEIWLEKDALAGVLLPVTFQYDVPLMVMRGYSSLSFLHSAAVHIASVQKPTFIFHLGDYDPSGVDAGRKVDQTLRQMAPEATIGFERIAVTPEQIVRWDLPTRPTKTTDSRAKGFGDVSVELDAIPATQLRDLVEQAIQRHLPACQLDVLLAAEQSERELLGRLVGSVRDAARGGEART